MWPGTNYEYYTFWPIQNLIWARSGNQLCKWSTDLLTHFRLLAIPIYDFEKAKIHLVIWRFVGILYFLAYPKCLLGEVEKATLQVVKGVNLTHFLLQIIPKYDFNKVEKAMIKWDAWH